MSTDRAVRLPASTPQAQIQELGYVESFDAVVDKMYAYLIYKETKPDKGTWRIQLKGSVTAGTFVDPFHSAFKGAVQKAAGHDATSFEWGYALKPKADDPRQVELRILMANGEPSGVQLTLITRQADGSAREPQVLNIPWPSGVAYKPSGYPNVLPYLIVAEVEAELAFIQQALGGETIEQVPAGDGPVMHGESRVGDSVIMLGRAMPPKQPPVPAMCYVYVKDCDATYQAALAAGATSLQEPTDAFYGDRNAGVESPSGIRWWMATHIEDVPPDEIARRAAAQMGGGQ